MQNLALKNILARIWKHQNEGDPDAPLDPISARILIADDSRTVVYAVKSMLEAAGYETLSASDGAQAVEKAKQQRPDLILMDVVMPVMNGFEAMRIIRNTPAIAATPIVVITGEQASDRAWGARFGAKGFLVKPIARDELLLMVRYLLQQARTEARTAAPVRVDEQGL